MIIFNQEICKVAACFCFGKVKQKQQFLSDRINIKIPYLNLYVFNFYAQVECFNNAISAKTRTFHKINSNIIQKFPNQKNYTYNITK